MEDSSMFQPPEVLYIPYKALEDLLKYHSNKLVGKTLKRIEISDSKEVMKAQIKELIYEESRGLTDIILALNYGLKIREIIPIKKENKE